jgi:hypothetical protein
VIKLFENLKFHLKGKKGQLLYGKKYKLLNLHNTKPGTSLHSLADVLTRMENISYILAWTSFENKVPFVIRI